jgi:curved DNA-binding protein CbpA
MLTAVDPYRVLQVIPDAEPEVIRAAYRALARKYHPDVGGCEAQMAMLNAAWETLRDRGERARYDRHRRTAAAAQTTQAERHGVDHRTPATTPSPRPMSPRARSGTVLDFGRYAGFSLRELAIHDPDYLEWLARTSIGRRLQREIEALLAASRPTTPPTGAPPVASLSPPVSTPEGSPDGPLEGVLHSVTWGYFFESSDGRSR